MFVALAQLAVVVVVAMGAVGTVAAIRQYTTSVLVPPATLIQLERRADERDRRCEWWAEMYQTTCLQTLPPNL